MKKISQILMLFITTVFTMVSCKKDEVSSTSIVGKWKMSGYIHNDIDVFGTGVGPCIIDNLITFSSTNVVEVDEGPTKCSASDPQISTGTYSITPNQTNLSITYDGSIENNDILTLNTTILKLKQLSNNDIVTYTRQP